MALIECSECKSQVSSAAAACPKCGHPISATAPTSVKPARKKTRFGTILLIFAGAVAFLAILSTVSEKRGDSKSSKAVIPSKTAGTEAISNQPSTASSAGAGEFDAPTETLNTEKKRGSRYGVIEIVKNKDDFNEQVSFNGRPVSLSERLIGLGPITQYKSQDALLVELNNGGTACAVSFVFLVASEKGLSASEPFGSCGDLVRVTSRPDKFVVRTRDHAFFATSQGTREVSLDESRKEEQSAELDNANTSVLNVFRPLVKADMKMYKWCGLLEQTDHGANEAGEEFNTYVVQVGQPQYKFSTIAYLKTAVLVDIDQLRIGGQVCITGRYIGNMPYQTVGGASGQAPMLAAFRVSTDVL